MRVGRRRRRDRGRVLRPATIAVRAGRAGGPGVGVNPAISMSSTFEHGGDHVYGRDDNPTWEAFEAALGGLEGGSALSFASGMGAISAVLELVPVGGRVVVAGGVYNGTRKWCADAAARGRLAYTPVDGTDAAAVIAAAQGADLVWMESPTNPCLDIGDIAAISAGVDCRVAVDNTMATPILQRPLGLGADFVVHSVTKWIGGHSDLLMGAVVAGAAVIEEIRERRSLNGAIPGSFEAWLALRGLRTLPARMQRAQQSAGELAARLSAHPMISRVRYPGLPDDPGHAIASRQMDGPGGLVSFEVSGGAAAAEAVCAAVEVLTDATSLGGVETLIERRGRYLYEDGTPPALLRMSVGQEDVEDLWEDLDRALGSVR